MGRFEVESLGEAQYPSPITTVAETRFANDSVRLRYSPHVNLPEDTHADESFEIAGPRDKVYFEPGNFTAAIVTCGGLCPGLNAVIRSCVLQLWYLYGCRDILGVRYGYGGLGCHADAPLKLTPDIVSDIHNQGGTFLGSSRGAPPVSEIVNGLVSKRVDVLLIIGGDGTMRGGEAIWEEIKRRQLNIGVVGIPKTIDNDIPFVRRSFGFETAVSIATESIRAAEAEAKGAPYGIGLVKLMGRHAGFITATACLATGDANYCLIPEMPFELEGPEGLFALLEKRLRSRRHAVIVLAEGAGQHLFNDKEAHFDASGNKKLQDIGLYLKKRINEHFADSTLPVTLKYIDPSYLIRSAPANPTDQLLCDRMARHAVHAAMAGKSGMLIGYWLGQLTHVPFNALNVEKRRINPEGELWFSVLESTGQPHYIGEAEHIEQFSETKT